MFNSPSTPSERSSTREPATLDGSTDETEPPPPVDSAAAQGPVVRSPAEIRADLAPSIGTYGGGETRGVRTVQHWALRFGDVFVADTSSPATAAMWQAVIDERTQLLAEVEAAHRFEQAWTAESAGLVNTLNGVAAERDALRAEAEGLRREAATKDWQLDCRKDAIESAQRAFQAVERLCASFDPTSGSGRARAFVGDVRAALAAAADAPQPTPAPPETRWWFASPGPSPAQPADPPTCEHGKTERHTFGEVVSKHDAHWRPRECPGPSPAVLPEKEQRP